ncbi:HTH-type transcriptional regulator glnR [Chlamydia trachomatis]|nr:HTH-type transcriptional regulator glnR [Chlamydia trachomatis]CRH94141.1 HTH-type transcriptional regulator glnR [Chlamydia trachomatis]
MREKELRRSLAVFPMGSVMKLTDLTARQIRYYEEQGLIEPDRNEGNRRMYSLNDMDRLLEIKDYIADGYNIAAIKREYEAKELARKQTLSDSQVRQILHDELTKMGGFTTSPNGFNSFRF